jgi:predicted transcriptional regulator
VSRVYKINRTLQYNKRKSKVQKLILRDPGVRYKKLQRITGLPNGSLSYILRKLESSRLVIVNRANKSTAYYPKGIRTAELHLIENIRNNVDRKIAQYLLDRGRSTFYDIVNHSERSPSTVSWHLNRLRNRKLIVSTSHHGEPQAYKIMNKNNVIKVLKHRRKFV